MARWATQEELDDIPPPEDRAYWEEVRLLAEILGTDGCTRASPFHREACWEHDIHWRTGQTIFGTCLTPAQMNRRFRLVIQSRSPLGRWSPMSWWRWVGTSIYARIQTPAQCAAND